jgi:hypothetical protein
MHLQHTKQKPAALPRARPAQQIQPEKDAKALKKHAEGVREQSMQRTSWQSCRNKGKRDAKSSAEIGRKGEVVCQRESIQRTLMQIG